MFKYRLYLIQSMKEGKDGLSILCRVAGFHHPVVVVVHAPIAHNAAVGVPNREMDFGESFIYTSLKPGKVRNTIVSLQ